MSIVSNIREDMLQAKRDRNPHASFLSMLYSDVVSIGKNAGNRDTTDPEAVACIKKVISNLGETMGHAKVANLSTEMVKGQAQIDLASKYLPSQMEGDELKHVIQSIIERTGASSPKDMGQVMGALKNEYPGQYDGKEASTMVKGLLA